jgi:SAM-dependent methyltransferase
MGAASSKVFDGPRHAARVAIPMDAATITAIVAAVNEQQLAHMLPPLLMDLHGQVAEDHKDHEEPLSILDLDCDAGHDTLTLACLTRSWRKPVQLEGWDRDKEKLEIATIRCKDVHWENSNSSVTFNHVSHWGRLQKRLPILPYFRHMYDFVLSSLMMQRLPLDLFFRGIEGLLGRDGVALVTCVHPDFGATERGSIGSEDEKGGLMEEVRSMHSMKDVLEAAARSGLTLQGVVKEAKLSMDVVQRLEHSQREVAREWVGRKIWFGIVFQRISDHHGP